MNKKNRKILMIVDNCTAHTSINGLSNIKLLFLPPNMTSRIQPLDQGIIKTFKTNYRNQLLKTIVTKLRNTPVRTTATQSTKTVNILDAVTWINSSWKMVSTECISKGFKKAGFSIGFQGLEHEEFQDVIIPDATLNISPAQFVEYVEVDDDVAVCCAPNQYDILIAVLEKNNDGMCESDTDEEVEQEMISNQELLKSISTIKKFTVNTLPSIFAEITNVEQKITNFLTSKSTKQVSILDFFKKLN